MARRSNDVYEAVYRASLELFSEKGFSGTSMRDLAKSSGVTLSNIYNYSSSKEEWLYRIIHHTLKELLSLSAPYADNNMCPVLRVQRLVGEHVGFHLQHVWAVRVMHQQVHHLTEEHLDEVIPIRNEYEARFRTAIHDGIQTGVFAATEERLAAFAIIWMGTGVQRWYRPDGPDSAADVATTYADFSLRLLKVDQRAHVAECGECAVGDSRVA